MEILRRFVKNHKNWEKRINHLANIKTVETVKKYLSKVIQAF